MHGVIQIPSKLEIEPTLRLHAQQPFETKRRVRRHAPLAMHQFVDARIGDADAPGKFGLGDAERLEELFQLHLTGVCWRAVGWDSHHA